MVVPVSLTSVLLTVCTGLTLRMFAACGMRDPVTTTTGLLAPPVAAAAAAPFVCASAGVAAAIAMTPQIMVDASNRSRVVINFICRPFGAREATADAGQTVDVPWPRVLGPIAGMHPTQNPSGQ